MKKLLIASAVLIFCGCSLVGGLVLANRATAEAQRDFFEKIRTQDVEGMLQESIPELRADIDRPVLEAWMAQVNATLGEYQGVGHEGFGYQTQQDGNRRITTAVGIAQFEKGTAQTELTYLNGQLAGFKVNSAQIPTGWFQGPDDTQLYHGQTEGFFKDLVAGDVDATSRWMHEALRKAVPADALQPMAERVGEWIGTLEQVEIVGESFENRDRELLTIRVRLHGTTADTDAMVKFEFAGLKGHLIEFDVTPPTKVEAPLPLQAAD